MPSSPASVINAPPSFDVAAIRKHTELLHRSAKGCDGKFIVSIFNDDLPGIITRHKVGDVDGMVAAIMAHALTPGANVYIGLHLMRSDLPRGRRGTKNDIVGVLGLVADMDADTGKLGKMPIEPSYVVETSPGNSQPTILFDRVMVVAKAEPLAKALRKATQSDFGTGDIAHIWRVAGTLNWPGAAKLARGRSPEIVAVRFEEAFEGLVYSEAALVEVLKPFFTEEPSPTLGECFTGIVEIGPLWERLSDLARAVLIADGQPDRSVHAARVVERLHHEVFSLNEIFSLCRERAGAWAQKYPNDASLLRDIERLWNKHATAKEAQRKANAEAVRDFLHSEHVVERDPMPTPPALDTTPFCLDRPGGLITDISQWIFQTSPSPIAEFSIMSAVALLCGLFGRRWLTPDGLGLNLYVAHVAGSGFGKDRPLKALAQLAESVGRGHVIGPNDVASDSAIEFILRQNPCQVLPLDELGMFFGASGKMSDSHSRAKRKSMLELYSSATSSWVAKVRASDGMNGQPPRPKIQWPTLSFLGATTPGTFYDGLEDDAFRSGFIARLIVVAIDKPPSRQRITGHPEVPLLMVERLTAAVAADPSINAMKETLARDSALKPRYSVASWADEEAILRLDQIRDWALDISISDERRGQIVNRAGDHTSKLATIRALSRDSANPVVTVQDLEWAFGIVWRSIQTVEDGADRFMSGSAFESLCKAILEAVRQCKDAKGLKNAELLRKPGVSHADERMIGDALSRLVSGTGQLQNIGSSMGKTGKGGRYVLSTEN
jgi:RepB DNA-primase from phage plasmid